MADSVIFKRDGLYESRWNGKRQEHDVTPADPDRCLTYLRCACTVDDGITLLEVFRAVAAMPMLKAFVSQYSWCWAIDQFFAQIEEPMRTEKKDGECIEWLEVGWASDLHEYDGDSDFSISVDFRGIGVAGSADYRPNGREVYSCSCTPLYDLADLPVRLNEKVEVWHVGGSNKRPVLTGTHCFSLLEVLDAIFDDISFYGGPAEARDFIEELKDIKAGIDDGTIETIPFDEAL